MKVYAVTMQVSRHIKYLIESESMDIGSPGQIRDGGVKVVDDPEDECLYLESVDRLEVGSIDEALERAEELDLYSIY